VQWIILFRRPAAATGPIGWTPAAFHTFAQPV